MKGVSNFLHIRTHRDTISDAQKGRGDRLQAIEEFANQMVRLKEQVHDEEKRVLQRTLEHKVEGQPVIEWAVRGLKDSRGRAPASGHPAVSIESFNCLKAGASLHQLTIVNQWR